MKICLVSQEYPPQTGGGGIGTQTWLKAQGLSARGHEVHVVSASWDKEPRTYLDNKAIIHRIAEPDLGKIGFELCTYWMAYSMSVARKLDVLGREVKFDIIQFPEYGGEGFVYQTDTFTWRTAKYVVQLHGPLVMFGLHMGWPEPGSTMWQVGCFMERTSIHHSDLVMASSHSTASLCQREYGYPADKAHIIHSAVDLARFGRCREPSEAAGPRILFVGNFVGAKGFDMLVQSVIRLRDRYPALLLRLIGKGDADHVADQKAIITAANAEAHFEFTGYVNHDSLPEHYAWCDIFAGPSAYEGGPGNVYMEAMAAGRPVIACNAGGVGEVVLHDQTGLLIPPRDADALEQAIIRLADDRPLRHRLGAAGRARIEEHYTVEKYVDRVETLYKGLLA